MSTPLKKLLFIGDAECGKDTLAEIFYKIDERYRGISSSTFLTTRVMMPYFTSIGAPYSTVYACHADRRNHRETWYEQIEKYNSGDWSRTAREIFEEGYSIYIGMRSPIEFAAAKHLFDCVIYIDAKLRLGGVGDSTERVGRENADIIIYNNGTLEEFEASAHSLYERVCSS